MTNDDKIIAIIIFQTILFMCDVGVNCEGAILNKYKLGKIDFLKVDHTSSGYDFCSIGGI